MFAVVTIALAGKYSSLTGLATMDFSSETANSAHSSTSSEQVRKDTVGITY